MSCPAARMSLKGTLFFAFALALLAPLSLQAQEKPTLTPSDYDQWERLGSFELSPDGRWIVSSITRNDGDTRLELRATDGDGDPIVLDYARSAEFSADSRWMTFRQGISSKEAEDADKPISDRLGLVNMQTLQDTVLMEMRSSSFRDDGTWLAVMGAPPADSVGGDLVVFQPGSEVVTTLGSIDSFSWQDEGDLLAYSIRSSTGSGNGVSLFHPEEGRIVPLVSGTQKFGTPTWHETLSHLAVFRSVTDKEREGEAQDILYWKDPYSNPASRMTLTNSRAEFGDTLAINTNGGIDFAPDGSTVFFGLRPWIREVEEETVADSVDAECTGDEQCSEEEEVMEDDPEEAEPSDVQVWHWNDDEIIRGQESRASFYERRTLMAAWHLDTDDVVRLGTEYEEAVGLVGDLKRWGIVGDRDPDHVNLRYGLGTTDYYKVDITDGSRTLLVSGLSNGVVRGTTGHKVLYYKDGAWWAHDLDTDERVSFASRVDASNREATAPDFEMGILDYDYPGPHPPWRDVAWFEGDTAALLVGRYDIWKADFETGNVTKLTEGEPQGFQFRPVNLDPEARSFFEPTVLAEGDPLWLSIQDLSTRASGYAVIEDGMVDIVILEDASISGLKTSMDGSVIAFSRQTWADSPDVFAGSEIQQAKAMTTTNSFQHDYAWGRNELLHYTTDAGHDLQAILTYPADFEPDQKYPLILYQYEKLSAGLHRYDLPNKTRYYNYQTWSQNGYFVLRPDVIYEDGRPGPSAVDAFESALDAAVATGHVDESALGLIGHSWGGYQAAYVPTRTDRFAASVAGAAITDFISFPGTIHWSGGGEEFSHWERGQARMAVPPWDDLEGHLESSPINFIHELNTPVLLMHGDDDGVVDFRQGQQYYNYARRAGKPVVMLVYPGAGHGLSVEHQQVDYHDRILQWFDHYLKGGEAASWITTGESWQERAKRMEGNQ